MQQKGLGKKQILLVSILLAITIFPFLLFGGFYHAFFISIYLSEHQSPVQKKSRNSDNDLLIKKKASVSEKLIMSPRQSFYGIVNKKIPSPTDTLKSFHNFTKIKFAQSPSYGKHRPDVHNVVMSMVYGYKLENIILFLTSLIQMVMKEILLLEQGQIQTKK